MSDENPQYFHFTIGPVQSFVGQARRTRDFWAGSFLLSWLSGIAMQSVLNQNDQIKIIFPKADQEFLGAIKGIEENKPKQGSIPNRFKAKVYAGFKPYIVLDNVQMAWLELSAAVYDLDIKSHELENTKEIWKRQISNFWDMSWVLVDKIEDSSALDRRKNFRSHFMPAEAGIKCSLMGDWQELSGVLGVRRKDNEARKLFWGAVGKNKVADFKDGEFLCAMALIKRRFTNVFDQHFKVGFKGWKLPNAVPSVSYIAAAPWFARVLKNECLNTIVKNFVIESTELIKPNDYGSGIRCMDKVAQIKEDAKGLDGNVFHEAALDNENIFSNQKQAQVVKRILKNLIESNGKVSPFYAILMMDGDSLGKQMSKTKKQEGITEGLNDFIKKVPKIVKKNNGYLIYAGGDDVLALVTLDDVLKCAFKIRKHYKKCFKHKKKIKTSISAAIIYAHIRIPLSNLIHDIHGLLDDVAKDYADRNALAVRVYKPGGIALEWSKKWKHAKSLNNKKLQIENIVKKFKDAEDSSEQFSNKFFHKIRQRFSLFDESSSDFDFDTSVQIMAMEYCKSVDNQKVTIDEAKKIVEPLLMQCQDPKTGKIKVDAALLVKFLAQKGLEG